MKTIKSVSTDKGTVVLYQVGEQYFTMVCQDGLEIPTLPTEDWNMANYIFDVKLEQLNYNKELQ